MNIKTMLPILAVAASLGAGCVSAPMPPVDRRVTIAEDLGHDLYVTDVRCTKGQSDYLTFQANVVNNTRSDLGVAWKVQWLDADGMEIDSVVSKWKEMVIAPKDVRALKGTAPNREAVDMRFYVRSR